MSKYAFHPDENHDLIEQALRDLQWGVKSLARVGGGWPDILAVKAGRIVLIEVKNPKRYGKQKKATAAQQEVHSWFRRYGVQVLTVTTVADLQQLDRDARTVHEPCERRSYYPE